MKQYTTTEKILILQQVAALAVEISETTPHDVFFDYHPHCDGFTAWVHIDGWMQNRGGELHEVFFNQSWNNPQKSLEVFIARLEELRKDTQK
jgi:hypothetical protein